MRKVLTFSRVYPSYHPRKGEPTYFVEKIWNCLEKQQSQISRVLTPLDTYIKEYVRLHGMNYKILDEKYHTIRAGHRFKEGDWFSPRVWSGKPYASKQIIIAHDIQVKKTWDFYKDEYKWMFPSNTILQEIAENDGLSQIDFIDWFSLYPKKIFDGQIICWNETIEYS